jgi:hypothetical protein
VARRAAGEADEEMRHADVVGSSLRAGRLGGPLAYVAAWLAAGLVVAALAVTVLGHSEQPARRAIAVPPIREIALPLAARKAGCDLDARRPVHRNALAHLPQPIGMIYQRPVSRDLRERAVRRGLIVIEYGADATDASLDTLKAVQRTAPAGTILAPGRSAQRGELTATSFRRRLRCARMRPAVYDALLLFRGRYLGSVPPS